jgi:hypothetical protein
MAGETGECSCGATGLAEGRSSASGAATAGRKCVQPSGDGGGDGASKSGFREKRGGSSDWRDDGAAASRVRGAGDERAASRDWSCVVKERWGPVRAREPGRGS